MLCPVCRIVAHAFVRQVTSPTGGATFSEMEKQVNAHRIRLFQICGSPLFIKRHRSRTLKNKDVADADIDGIRIERLSGTAGGCDDASPVGICAEYSRFDQTGT